MIISFNRLTLWYQLKLFTIQNDEQLGVVAGRFRGTSARIHRHPVTDDGVPRKKPVRFAGQQLVQRTHWYVEMKII